MAPSLQLGTGGKCVCSQSNSVYFCHTLFFWFFWGLFWWFFFIYIFVLKNIGGCPHQGGCVSAALPGSPRLRGDGSGSISPSSGALPQCDTHQVLGDPHPGDPSISQ